MTEIKEHACEQHASLLASLYSKHHHIPPFIQILVEHGTRMYAKQVPRITGKSPMGQCYRNSALLAIDGGLTYCEGFAMKEGLIPMEHAWLIDRDGKVIDPTWEGNNEYFGVAFREDFVMEFAETTKYYGIGPNLYMIRKDLDAILADLRAGLATAAL